MRAKSGCTRCFRIAQAIMDTATHPTPTRQLFGVLQPGAAFIRPDPSGRAHVRRRDNTQRPPKGPRAGPLGIKAVWAHRTPHSVGTFRRDGMASESCPPAAGSKYHPMWFFRYLECCGPAQLSRLPCALSNAILSFAKNLATGCHAPYLFGPRSRFTLGATLQHPVRSERPTFSHYLPLFGWRFARKVAVPA